MKCEDEEQCMKLQQYENSEAAWERLVTNICNEFMQSDKNGRFFGSTYADDVNKMLGIE